MQYNQQQQRQQQPSAQWQYQQYPQQPQQQYYPQQPNYQQVPNQQQQYPQNYVYQPHPYHQQQPQTYNQYPLEKPQSSFDVEHQGHEQQHRPNQSEGRSGRQKIKWSAGADDGTFTPLAADQRMPFIRKVYALIFMQLCLTVLMCVIAYVSEGFRNFQVKYWVIMVLCVIIGFVIEIMIFCYPKYAWKVPRNYILLGIFTFCMAWVVSYSCSQVFVSRGENGAFIVLMSACLTLGVVVGLSIYAWKTKTDFTTKGSALFMCLIALIIFGILASIFNSKALMVFYAFLVCLLFGAFLIYDTQLILGNKTHKLSIDDYIIGAMIIYIDIIQLFLHILYIFLACSD